MELAVAATVPDDSGVIDKEFVCELVLVRCGRSEGRISLDNAEEVSDEVERMTVFGFMSLLPAFICLKPWPGQNSSTYCRPENMDRVKLTIDAVKCPGAIEQQGHERDGPCTIHHVVLLSNEHAHVFLIATDYYGKHQTF